MVKRNLTDVVAINIHFSRVSIKATDILLQRRRILRRKKREKSAAYTWSQKNPGKLCRHSTDSSKLWFCQTF